MTCDRLHRALDALNVIRVWANTGIIGALPESVVEIIDKATEKQKAK